MELIGAILIWGVLGWWAHHHQRFKAGKVKRPFFSLGQRPSPVRHGRKDPAPIRHRKDPAPIRRQPPVPSIIPLPKVSRVQPPSLRIPVALLIKLDRYTYNRETSERLVQQAAECNPGKSGQWCAEKALWDLERDRH